MALGFRVERFVFLDESDNNGESVSVSGLITTMSSMSTTSSSTLTRRARGRRGVEEDVEASATSPTSAMVPVGSLASNSVTEGLYGLARAESLVTRIV